MGIKAAKSWPQQVRVLGRFWLAGIRIYIAFGAVIVSLVVWWWVSAAYGGSPLKIIRIQEAFAWLSIGLLCLTILIGPLMKIFRGFPGRSVVYDSRRALGISAAWFGLLHTAIVYFIELKAGNPLELPSVYRQASLLGVIALFCLLLLASTSVNRLMRSWGIWWFRLHRLVYVAIILAVLHALMIGAHATNSAVLAVIGGLSLLWIGLHSYIAFRLPSPRSLKLVTLSLSAVLLVTVLGYGLSQRASQAAQASRTLHGAEHNH